MTKHPTLLASWFDAVLDQLELHGLDPVRLTRGLWGPGARRTAPTREVGLVIARRLWHRAAALSEDPLLGIRVGCALPMQAMNVTGLVMMHSPTLRDALVGMERYQRLVSNSGRIRLNPAGGDLVIGYSAAPCAVPMHTMQIDSLFAAVLTFLQHCCARAIRPRRVALPGSPVANADEYSMQLGVPVELGAPSVRIEYPARILHTPFQGADPALLAMARTQADSMLRVQDHSESLVAAVRESIRNREFARSSCRDIAEDLAITVRTLQRRLAAAGTSFRRMQDMVRMEEAFFLLTQRSLTLPEIARRLGYAEQSSFWRAVRSYWGATPRQLRLESTRNGTGER